MLRSSVGSVLAQGLVGVSPLEAPQTCPPSWYRVLFCMAGRGGANAKTVPREFQNIVSQNAGAVL